MQKPIYTFHDKILCFITIFNEPIDPYYHIMKDATTVIFGKKYTMPNYSLFNQPIVLTPKIQIFGTGEMFNQPLFLTKTMRILSLGLHFDHQIILTPNLTHVTFWIDGNFNQPIVLNKKITHMTFGNFNKPINLTLNLVVLKFGNGYNQPIVLNRKIKYLTFGYAFNHPIIPTPNITMLMFDDYPLYPIVLMTNITHLTIGIKNSKTLDDLPHSLKELVIKCQRKSSQCETNNLHPHIKKITFEHVYFGYKNYITPEMYRELMN